MLLLVLLVVVTYIPQLHINPDQRSQALGLLIVTAFAALRSWSIKLGRKVVPPAQQHREGERE